MLMVFVPMKVPMNTSFPYCITILIKKPCKKNCSLNLVKIYVHMISIRCKNGYFKINDSNQTLFEDIY